VERQLADTAAAITTTLTAKVSDISREQARQVVQAVGNTTAANVQAALASALPAELGGQAMQAALQRSLGAAVSNAVSQQLSSAFQEQFTGLIVPQFQAAVRDMFRQIELAYSGWLAEQSQQLAGITSEVGAAATGAGGECCSLRHSVVLAHEHAVHACLRVACAPS
jgi:hypothetical protein